MRNKVILGGLWDIDISGHHFRSQARNESGCKSRKYRDKVPECFINGRYLLGWKVCSKTR